MAWLLTRGWLIPFRNETVGKLFMKTYTSVEYKANTKQYNIEVEFYCQSGFGKVSFTINEEALSKICVIQCSNVEILNYPGNMKVR